MTRQAFFPKPARRPSPLSVTIADRFSLGLNGGVNIFPARYTVSANGPGEALNSSTKPAAGSSYGLGVRYRMSKKFSVSAGLEYHRTLNTFGHVTERDTMIDHPSPINSGLTRAVLRRRVADNLRTRFITVPILLHWHQTGSNFRVGAGAGIGLNFRRFANGTTLNPEGEFITFDAATGPATTPNALLSLQLSPSAAYRLKPTGRLWLEAKVNLRYVSFGADELSGAKRSNLLSGFNIGIRYGL